MSNRKAASLLLGVVYLASYWLLLVNVQGVYFDDWTLYDQEAGDLIQRGVTAGLPWRGFFHAALAGGLGPWSYRMVTFTGYLVAAMALFSLLNRLRRFDRLERLLIALLFAVLPLNGARIAAICSPYALSYGLFWCGFALFAAYLDEGRWWRRVVAAGLFLASFSTPSLLVFYGLVPCYLLYLERRRGSGLRALARRFVGLAELWLLPLAFFWVTASWFRPTGLLAGYNQVSPQRILFSLGRSLDYVADLGRWDSLGSWMREYPFAALPRQAWIIAATAVVLALALLWVGRPRKEDPGAKAGPGGRWSHAVWAAVGAAVLWLGVYPYIVVGRIPAYLNWDSRHQLLMPLGLALLLVHGVRLLSPRSWLPWIGALLVSSCIVVNNMYYFALLVDDLQQQAMIAHFRRSEVIRGNVNFAVAHRGTSYLAVGRSLRFYEYGGMLRAAFGDARRFAAEEAELGDLSVYEPFVGNPIYNLGSVELAPPEWRIVVVGSPRLAAEPALRVIRYALAPREARRAYAAEFFEVRTERARQGSGGR